MKCPHCDVAFHEDEETWEGQLVTTEKKGGGLWACGMITCPECVGVILYLGTQMSYVESFQDWYMIYPSSPSPKVSGDVPEPFRVDYIEAHLVLPISAKASAALSRRILQSVLKNQGYEQGNLYAQIKGALAEKHPDKVLPSGLRDLIEAVRRFGNFSAHPITDVTGLQLIDVEPREAEWCLEIIDALFDHYYVRPAMNTKRLSDLDQKLQQAGINPIGPQAQT